MTPVEIDLDVIDYSVMGENVNEILHSTFTFKLKPHIKTVTYVPVVDHVCNVVFVTISKQTYDAGLYSI